MLIVVLVGYLCWISCGHPCDNESLSEVWSPGRTRKAIIFGRSCGATTPFTENVSVLWAGEKLPNDPSGNAFSADSNHGAVQNIRVNVEWISEDQILVTYPVKVRILFQAIRLRGTNVRYVRRDE